DFRWIDDRRELIEAEHAKVGDGEGRASVLLRRELPLTRALGEIFRLAGDVPQGHAVGVEQDGSDQPIFDSHCHGDMDSVEMTNLVTQPVRVHLWMFGER